MGDSSHVKQRNNAPRTYHTIREKLLFTAAAWCCLCQHQSQKETPKKGRKGYFCLKSTSERTPVVSTFHRASESAIRSLGPFSTISPPTAGHRCAISGPQSSPDVGAQPLLLRSRRQRKIQNDYELVKSPPKCSFLESRVEFNTCVILAATCGRKSSPPAAPVSAFSSLLTSHVASSS